MGDTCTCSSPDGAEPCGEQPSPLFSDGDGDGPESLIISHLGCRTSDTGGGDERTARDLWKASWTLPHEEVGSSDHENPVAAALRDQSLLHFTPCSLMSIKKHQEFLKALWILALRFDHRFDPILTVVESLPPP